MTPAPRYCSDSRIMEASGEVKKEPASLAAHRDALAGKEGGRLIKRKRAASESEQGQKRSHGVNAMNSSSRAPPSKSKSAKDTGVVNSTAGKRKRASSTAEEVDPVDDSALNAAQALFELFGGSGTSQKDSPDHKSCDADGVKWAGKKSRSSRSKKADDCACKLSSSSTTSATVTDIPEVLDSSASHNHHVAVSITFPAGVETVNLEDESEADADAKSTDMSPYGLSFDRGHRLLSQSSVESTLLDSRAESPSSPLRVLRPEAPLLPKLEEELMLQFGFQRQTPVRPVVKPAILRKPKAEEICAVESDELKEVKIALNKVQRRKPRAPTSKGQPLLLQGDVLDVPITSSATVLKECIEENKFQVPITLNLFEPVKLETGRVKLEGRELYQTGSSTQGRLRTALSEAEKEARRLRRVQANRESARQTIRRKQVLCEELARKAGELQTEKENLAQSLEQKNKELRNHQEINRHLKEQIVLQAGSAEAPLSSTKASDAASPVPPTGPIQGMPMIPYWWAFALAQMAAATQSATPPQMGEPGAAPAAPDMNSVIAATVAAFNNGAGMNPNMWMNMMSGMPTMPNIPTMPNMSTMPSMPNMSGNKLQIPGAVAAEAEQQAQQQPTLAHSAARPTPTLDSAPHKPAASMAAAQPVQPQALGRSAMTMSGHPHAGGLSSSSPMKSGILNVDPSVTMSRPHMNGSMKIPAVIPSNPSSRGKYQTGLVNGGPSPLIRSSSGTLIRSSSGMSQMSHIPQMSQMHASADGMPSTSTNLSLGLATHQSLPGRMDQQMRKPVSASANLRFFPTIGNGVQGFLGPRVGAYQSEAAALATEARRRRRELKRTKSLQSQLQQEKKLASVKSL
ncbi:hypothetical protein KC19_2G244800 [Ceratodon purpureus]|uniref:BZIP domain-containing protein n=2 Tax=Ceratodon purpureus TaxID=3225 RepID=A0A8T0J0N5_CERPU|nr:hypothetical protein KC19_2G244800 [Ceratodon purpureus]